MSFFVASASVRLPIDPGKTWMLMERRQVQFELAKLELVSNGISFHAARRARAHYLSNWGPRAIEMQHRNKKSRQGTRGKTIH